MHYIKLKKQRKLNFIPYNTILQMLLMYIYTELHIKLKIAAFRNKTFKQYDVPSHGLMFKFITLEVYTEKIQFHSVAYLLKDLENKLKTTKRVRIFVYTALRNFFLRTGSAFHIYDL